MKSVESISMLMTVFAKFLDLKRSTKQVDTKIKIDSCTLRRRRSFPFEWN